MYQDLLLKEIRRKIGEKSINEEISTILDISYDAAHRRTSLKSKFSLEESVTLAKYYQISLDQFLGNKNQLVVKRTPPIKTSEDLLDYFENSLNILSDFKNSTDSTIYYSAKDIPFFYTISESLLSKFKFFVWMNLLNQNEFFDKFENFTLPYHSSKNEDLTSLYENQNVIEIWNDSSITSVLRQIAFYSEIGLLNKSDAKSILEELQNLLIYIEKKVVENPNFEIYVNDLVILNNSIYFKNKDVNSYFIPFNMFGYMMTNDDITCDDTQNYFEHQMKNSKQLGSSGNRDRKLFFNKMKNQIDQLNNQLSLQISTRLF